MTFAHWGIWRAFCTPTGYKVPIACILATKSDTHLLHVLLHSDWVKSCHGGHTSAAELESSATAPPPLSILGLMSGIAVLVLCMGVLGRLVLLHNLGCRRDGTSVEAEIGLEMQDINGEGEGDIGSLTFLHGDGDEPGVDPLMLFQDEGVGKEEEDASVAMGQTTPSSSSINHDRGLPTGCAYVCEASRAAAARVCCILEFVVMPYRQLADHEDETDHEIMNPD